MLENKFTVSAINAFSDNYIWALNHNTSSHLVLVDPGDAQVCIDYIEQHQKILTDILITHHHNDHIGGLTALKAYCLQQNWPLTIYYPEKNNIEGDIAVNQNSIISLESIDAQFEVFDLPGHTLGHIAYVSENNLFCGDTLFSGGCGRLFEGSPEQMHASLTTLTELPEHTKVYCAHEYTKANVAFALTVEPSNVDLLNYYNQVEQLRFNNQATIPSFIGLEKKINPFLRCHVTEIKESAQLYSDKNLSTACQVFAEIRRWKDNF